MIKPTREGGITAALIEAAKTEKGGWTKAQLNEWGVPWPPPKGWKAEITITGKPYQQEGDHAPEDHNDNK